MPGLGPAIHVFRAAAKTWMAGTSPAMTARGDRYLISTSSIASRLGPSIITARVSPSL
jgi:hypothetical protein